MERVWIDWSRPFLPEAARWLLDRVDPVEGVVDLRRSWCVTPGARAGRILLALLVHECAARDVELLPPRVMTPGALADALVGTERPRATRTERLAAWTAALRACGRDVAAPLLPQPPDRDDVRAWRELAGTIEHLRETLAGEGIRFAEVPERAERLELFAEGDRWRALAAVADGYHARLAAAGLIDPDFGVIDAPTAAVEADAVETLALLGVTELNRVQCRVLETLGARAAALVHAPASSCDRFDANGCPDPEAWADAALSIADDSIIVADGPGDQAQAVLRSLAALDGVFGPEEITIGLGDDDLAEPITRAAEWASLDVHVARGTDLARTGPFRLLEAVAAWRRGTRFTDLAVLLRHPDVDPRLTRLLGGPDRHPGGAGAWLPRLDRYFASSLHEDLSEPWLVPDDARRPFDELQRAVKKLTAPLDGPARPLREWCEPVLRLLREVYTHLDAEGAGAAGHAHTHARLEACGVLRDVCARHQASAIDLGDDLDAPTAIALLLEDAGREHVAPAMRADQIEMLGWLELHLDPAPVLIVAGVNEGSVPESVHGDPFLPDALRRHLGIPDNRRRYGRDAYLLEAITRSRRHLTVVTGRTHATGDPLPPSRLLLACDDEAMLRRIRRICADDDVGGRPLPMGLPAPASASAFTVPELPEITPPEHMSVTDFRVYLRCPYRYALEKRLRLSSRHDDARELDPPSFGTLAHAVLRRFGRDEAVRDEDDPERIAAYLAAALRDEASTRFGAKPMPAVRVQLARLEQRLTAFASLQAALQMQGWTIEHAELPLPGDAHLTVPGQANMPLRGTIDRIDRHVANGRWRIIDYKTGDGGATPVAAHHGSQKLPDAATATWQDLQLPLYHHLATQQGIAADIELAYVLLPRKPEDVALHVAAWTPAHLASALARAREVVEDIRGGRFPMNPLIPERFDPFARICQTLAFPDAALEGEPVVAGTGGAS